MRSWQRTARSSRRSDPVVGRMDSAQDPSLPSMRDCQWLIVGTFLCLIFLHILLAYVFPWVRDEWQLSNDKKKILNQLQKEIEINSPNNKPDNTRGASSTANSVEEKRDINKPKFELKVKDKVDDPEFELKVKDTVDDPDNNINHAVLSGGNNDRENKQNKYFELICSNRSDSATTLGNSVISNNNNVTKKVTSNKKFIKPIYIPPPPSTAPASFEPINSSEAATNNDHHSIKQSQNEEYKRSLDTDMKNRVEKERLAAIAKKRNDYIESFQSRQCKFIPAEEPHHEEVDVVNVAIKYQPTQKKINRRFRRWNTTSDLLDFIESNNDCPIYTSIEVSIPKFPYGKKIIDHGMDAMSLSEAGIENNSIIWVHTVYDINTIGE